MNEEHIIAIAAIFIFSGFIKGVVGFGLPAAAIGLLGLIMPPAEAIALMIVPSFVTNLWQAFAGKHFSELVGRFWPMVGGVCFGIWIGAGFLTRDGGSTAAIVLGGVLAAYAVLGVSRVRFSVPVGAEGWLSPAAGTATGVLASMTGLCLVPAIPYLQATGLERDRLVQSLGLFLTVATLAMGVNLTYQGIFHLPMAGLSTASLLPAAAGMLLGQVVRRHVPEVAFRHCFLTGLFVLGCYLAWRASEAMV